MSYNCYNNIHISIRINKINISNMNISNNLSVFNGISTFVGYLMLKPFS